MGAPHNKKMGRPQIQNLKGDPRHGTVNGYQNCSCRCDRCRAAWAAYMAPVMARKRARERTK